MEQQHSHCKKCGACDQHVRCDHCGYCRKCGVWVAVPYWPYTWVWTSPPVVYPVSPQDPNWTITGGPGTIDSGTTSSLGTINTISSGIANGGSNLS